MERSVTIEGHCETSESTLVSKSRRSVIDSRPIELVGASEMKEAGKCGHFSIRGYVAEIRRKDRRICWPFSSFGNHNESEEQTDMLPPLHVSESRWWGCQNCLRKTGATGAATEAGVVSNCCSTGFKSNITGSHGNISMSSHGDALMLLSGFKRASEKIIGGRKADATIPVVVNGDEYCSLCCDKKEKEVEVVQTIRKDIRTSGDCEHSTEGNVNRAIPRPTCHATKVNLRLTGERVTKDKGHTSKLHSLEFDESDYGLSDNDENLVGHNLHGQLHATHHGNSGGSLHQRKIQKVRLLTDIVSSEVLGVSRKVCSSNGNPNADHIKIEVTHSKATPNASAGKVLHAVPKSLVLVQENIRKGILAKKKKRKIPRDEDWGPSQMSWPKSTSEKGSIFKEDAETSYIETAITNSESAEDAPAGIGLSTAVKNLLVKHRFDRKLILDKKKNKKLRVEDGRSSLTPWQEGVPREVQVIKGDVEIKRTGVETVASKSAQGAFMGKRGPFLESYVAAQRNEGKSILCKKKSKMPQVEDGWDSLTPWQKGMSREDQIIPFKSTPDALSERGMHNGLEIKKAAHRKAVASKKRICTLQVKGGGSSPMSQDVVIKCTGTETVPFKPAQDAFVGKRLDPFLKSFVAAQRNDRKSVLCKKKGKMPHVEDGQASIMPWQEGMFTEEIARVPIKSAPDAYAVRGVHRGLESKKASNRKAFVSKKQNNMARVESLGSFLMQQKDFSGSCNYEKTIGVERHSEVIKNQCDQRADKVCEQAALDDIPMEIVELMAKNQYERRLLDAEDSAKNTSCLSETAKNMKNADIMDFTELLGNARLLQEKKTHMQKPQFSNAESDIPSTGKGLGLTEQKSVGYPPVNRKYKSIPFNIGHPEESNASMGYPAFSLCLEKLSSGGGHVTGSRRNCDTRNHSCNGDMMGHQCSLNCLQSLEEYHTCQTVSQQISCKEAHHVWSLMIPNHMDFGINSPQKFVTDSSNLEMLPQCSESLSKGNLEGVHGPKSLNPNVANLQKQNGNFDVETFKRTNGGYPFACTQKGNECHPKLTGSLDLYTNETISAMHLLKLMDARMSSNTPVIVDENQKFPKQPSFLHNHHCKDFPVLEVGVSKASEASTPPQSDYFRKNQCLGNSCEYSPPVPTVDIFASSFQKDGNRRASGLTGQILAKMMPHSFKSRKEKTKCSYSSTQTRGLRSHSSVSRSGSSGKNHESVPIHDLKKGFLFASDSMAFPLQYHSVEDLTTHGGFEVNKKDGTVWHGKSSCRTEICTVNRNPAEFTLPEAGNVYMIRGEDLKYRKMIPSWERPDLNNMDGHKRQKMMKLTAIQEHVRH
ncbi:hypothetical protein HHK36_025646 [Tetracentron sinense]|uniref:Uncharacterized protein n=1 Tax=Tetracentron sinense TaxID=13715 RepID=A0A834YI07_TETSI|nr:hypothetical protein HHK36_025646 [Tetracentron sinense]